MRRYWKGWQGLRLIKEMREDLNQLYLVSAVGVDEMAADQFALAGVAEITADYLCWEVLLCKPGYRGCVYRRVWGGIYVQA